jgi:putative inorganic carbon (HCO3(-)) transporter
MKKKTGKKRESRVMERLAAGFLVLMASAYLLWPGWEGYAAITAHKWRLFLVLCGGFCALNLLLPLELSLVGGGRLTPPGRVFRELHPAMLLLLAYLLWSLVSALLSPWRSTALWGSPQRHEGLLTAALYVLCCCFVSRRGRADARLLGAFAAAAGLCAALALWQLAGGNPLGLYPAGMGYRDAFVKYAGAFLGTLGNEDLFAAVMSLAAPVLWVSILRGKGRLRFLLLLPLALCLAAMVWSRVWAGIAALLGSTLLALPVVLPAGKKARLAVLLLVLVLLAAGLAGVYLLGGRLGGAFHEASELLHGRAQDSFGSGRLKIWRELAPLIGDRPLLGGGPDTLALRNDIFFERFSPELGTYIRTGVDAAHNEYYHILLCQGIPGLLLYLASLGCALALWIRRSPESSAAAILGAGVLGYCIQAFFSISSMISAPFFWLALGLLLAEGKRS